MEFEHPFNIHHMKRLVCLSCPPACLVCVCSTIASRIPHRETEDRVVSQTSRDAGRPRERGKRGKQAGNNGVPRRSQERVSPSTARLGTGPLRETSRTGFKEDEMTGFPY